MSARLCWSMPDRCSSLPTSTELYDHESTKSMKDIGYVVLYDIDWGKGEMETFAGNVFTAGDDDESKLQAAKKHVERLKKSMVGRDMNNIRICRLIHEE